VARIFNAMSLAAKSILFARLASRVSAIKSDRPLLACIQARHASIISGLSDNAGAYKKKIRRGRGPASGKGKTSGRGHKGQGQHGKGPPVGFTGGQTPEHIVKGKRGFENM
jgi:large subunit ribosomal protein L15